MTHTLKLASTRYKVLATFASLFANRIVSKERAVIVTDIDPQELHIPQGIVMVESLEGDHILTWSHWAQDTVVKELDREYQTRKRASPAERRKCLEAWEAATNNIVQAERALTQAKAAQERAARRVIRAYGNNEVIVNDESYQPTCRGEHVYLVRRGK